MKKYPCHVIVTNSNSKTYTHVPWLLGIQWLFTFVNGNVLQENELFSPHVTKMAESLSTCCQRILWLSLLKKRKPYCSLYHDVVSEFCCSLMCLSNLIHIIRRPRRPFRLCCGNSLHIALSAICSSALPSVLCVHVYSLVTLYFLLLRKTFIHNAVCLLQAESSYRCPMYPLHVSCPNHPYSTAVPSAAEWHFNCFFPCFYV